MDNRIIDRAGLAEFLRRRREVLQPEDVGLPRGPRRRTDGLRREEVAALAHMSTDYYARLERGTGPQPSESMIASIAQGLHVTLDERDHLYLLAGHSAPTRGGTSDHVSPGLLRILDRLHDTPAEIVTELGETLRQSPLGTALTGDTTRLEGPSRSLAYRWFTDPATRQFYDQRDHEFLTRMFTSGLREISTLRGPDSKAARLADELLRTNDEFRRTWDLHEIGIKPRESKRFIHPELGALELTCQRLIDPDQGHSLLVYVAMPGTESHDKLELLSVIGSSAIAY